MLSRRWWRTRCWCGVACWLYRSAPARRRRGNRSVRSFCRMRPRDLSRGVACRLWRTRNVANRRVVLVRRRLGCGCRRRALRRRSRHISNRWSSSLVIYGLISRRRFLLVRRGLASYWGPSTLVRRRASAARSRWRTARPNVGPNRRCQGHAVGFLQQRTLLFEGHRTRWRGHLGSYLPRRHDMLRHGGRSAPPRTLPSSEPLPRWSLH